MKLKYNIFNLVTAVLFVLAFFCLMLFYITAIMFYPAMLFFAGAFGCLSAILIKARKKRLAELDQAQEVLVMERTMNDDGETFVMRDQRADKKERRKKRRQKWGQLMPIVFSILASAFFAVMFVLRLF